MKNIVFRLETFEGPFDLLYHLIEKNEIDIYDIPIHELTDQYIEYISGFEHKDMENMSEFIVMASNLLEIKSKMLLPKPKLEPDSEDIDPREELVQKLIEYKRFKSMMEIFKEREEQGSKAVFKDSDKKIIELLDMPEDEPIDDLLEDITMDKLLEIFQETILRKESRTDKIRSSFDSVTRDIYTVKEESKRIRSLLSIYKTLEFHRIFSPDSTKLKKIVTFLALLELIKQKRAKISQEKTFGKIIINQWNEFDYEN